MIKGWQYVLAVASMVSISLLDGKNIGLTKEIDNRRECTVCTVESREENGSGTSAEEAEDTLGYTDGFWVEEDETVYLLDTYGNRVLEIGRKTTREILLSDTVLPADIVSYKERLFLFDDLLSELQIYTKQGELMVRSKVELENDYVKQLNCLNGEVLLLTYGNQWYVVNQETGALTAKEERAVPLVEAGEYDFTEYVETDEDGKVYAVYTSLVEDCSIISGELVLQAVSKEGDLLGSYRLPTEQYKYLPDRYVQVHQNGNVYIMVPTETAVEVRKIALKESDVSHMTEFADVAEELEATYASKSKSRKRNGTAGSGEILYARTEVWERVRAMAEYQWTLKKTHTNISKSEKGVVLPREIAALKEKHAEESSWSENIIGIPYCWGGFYSLDVGFQGKSFQEVIDKKYVAGNINPVENYKYMTAGVDCSGYVCAAFGFTSKLNTSKISDLGSKVSDVRKLEQMDVLVYPGEHVIFFCEWLDDATMLVSESAVREGKVTIHPKSLNEFVVSSMYQMRSPW